MIEILPNTNKVYFNVVEFIKRSKHQEPVQYSDLYSFTYTPGSVIIGSYINSYDALNAFEVTHYGYLDDITKEEHQSFLENLIKEVKSP